jgi:hypothetical protein
MLCCGCNLCYMVTLHHEVSLEANYNCSCRGMLETRVSCGICKMLTFTMQGAEDETALIMSSILARYFSLFLSKSQSLYMYRYWSTCSLNC